MNKSLRSLLILSLAACAAVFSGCASAPKPEAMLAAKTDFGRQNAETVSLNVTGGAETSAMGTVQMGNQEFQTAVASSIEKSKLFSKVLGVDASDYHLEVMIARFETPMVGFSMTVTLEANWTLTRKSDKKVVYQKAVATPFTAKVGDAFVGATRVRVAGEGAARANIEQALTEIAALDLKAN